MDIEDIERLDLLDDRGITRLGCSVDHRLTEREEQSERGNRCRCNREAFGDGRRCVPQRVELVGCLPDLGWQMGHFGNAAGIVRNGAVGVDGHGDPQGRQHAYRCNGYAIDSTELGTESEVAAPIGACHPHRGHDHREC